MSIRHDRSSTSVVTTCSRCAGFWFAFNFDVDAARASGERHELEVHGIAPRDATAATRQAAYRARQKARAR